jgi:hypothetical protein
VSVAVFVDVTVPFGVFSANVAVMVTVLLEESDAAVVNVTNFVWSPAANDRDGTDRRTLGSLLASVTPADSPAGTGTLSCTVSELLTPPFTDVGETVSDWIAIGVTAITARCVTLLSITRTVSETTERTGCAVTAKLALDCPTLNGALDGQTSPESQTTVAVAGAAGEPLKLAVTVA